MGASFDLPAQTRKKQIILTTSRATMQIMPAIGTITVQHKRAFNNPNNIIETQILRDWRAWNIVYGESLLANKAMMMPKKPSI